MSRNVKVLGLAVVAVFAFSAVLASAAFAGTPRITVSKYPATFEGKQKTTNEFILPGSRKFTCEEIGAEGEYTQAQSEAATWSVSVIPIFKKCHAIILGNKTPVTVTTNGCYFTFTSGETKAGSTTEQTGSVHIVCPNGKPIEIHVWQNAAAHESNGVPICTYSVGAQGPLSTTHYTISTNASGTQVVTLNATVGNIATTRVSGTLTNCGAASQVAEYVGEDELWANNGGEMTTASMDKE